MKWVPPALLTLALMVAIAQPLVSAGTDFAAFLGSRPAATLPLGSGDLIPVLQSVTKQIPGTTYLQAAKADQQISGGANTTPLSLGTVTSGTVTLDCGARSLQYLTDGGAFTLAAPASDSSCTVMTINNATAGAITFSGFLVGSSTGDALDTTNGHVFSIFIWRINGTSGYQVAAHQ